MKKLLSGALLCCCLLPIAATAQTRRRAATPRRSSSAAATPAASELRDARRRVSTQIKTMTRFLYLYGRTSNTIETAQRQGLEDARGTTRNSRAALTNTLRDVRAGFDDLANTFNNSRNLRRFAPPVTEAAGFATQAEDLLAADKLDEAGRKLIDAVNRLADVLELMTLR